MSSCAQDDPSWPRAGRGQLIADIQMPKNKDSLPSVCSRRIQLEIEPSTTRIGIQQLFLATSERIHHGGTEGTEKSFWNANFH